MKPEIKQLIEMIRSSDQKKRQDGLDSLRTILEVNTFSKPEGYRLGEIIPWKLRLIVLSEQEQAEIAEQLSQIYIENRQNCVKSKEYDLISSILWVLGKTEGKTALVPLINIFKQCLTKFNENELFQASLSFSDCLYEVDAETKVLIEETNFISFLQSQSQSKDTRVSQWCKESLESLRELGLSE